MHIFKNTTFDFLRWRWEAIALSWALILAGALTFAKYSIPLGVEFAGGTEVVEQFDQAVSVDQVRTALNKSFAGGGTYAVVQPYGDASLHRVMRFASRSRTGGESGESLGTIAGNVEDAPPQGQPRRVQPGGREHRRSRSRLFELKSKALLATIFSLAGLLVYIAFRFQLSFAGGRGRRHRARPSSSRSRS